MTPTSSLTFDLTDEQRALRDTIREFAEGEIAPTPACWVVNEPRTIAPADLVRPRRRSEMADPT